MEGHIFHAAKLGMQYIWFTDHDIRMGRQKFQIDGFDFEQDSIFVEEESGRSQGFKIMEAKSEETFIGQNTVPRFKANLTKETCFTGTQCMKISNCSDDSG